MLDSGPGQGRDPGLAMILTYWRHEYLPDISPLRQSGKHIWRHEVPRKDRLSFEKNICFIGSWVRCLGIRRIRVAFCSHAE